MQEKRIAHDFLGQGQGVIRSTWQPTGNLRYLARSIPSVISHQSPANLSQSSSATHQGYPATYHRASHNRVQSLLPSTRLQLPDTFVAREQLHRTGVVRPFRWSHANEDDRHRDIDQFYEGATLHDLTRVRRPGSFNHIAHFASQDPERLAQIVEAARRRRRIWEDEHVMPFTGGYTMHGNRPRATRRDERVFPFTDGGTLWPDSNRRYPDRMDAILASARRRAHEDHFLETRGGRGQITELEAWDRRRRHINHHGRPTPYLSGYDDSDGDRSMRPRYRRPRRSVRDRSPDFPTRDRDSESISDEEPLRSDHDSDEESLRSDYEFDSEDEDRHARGRPLRHGHRGPRHHPPVNLPQADARRPRPPQQDAVPAIPQEEGPNTVSVVPDIHFDENGPHGTGRSTVDGGSVLGGGSARGSVHGSARESARGSVHGSMHGSARGTARGSRRNEGASVMDEPRRRPRNGRRR